MPGICLISSHSFGTLEAELDGICMMWKVKATDVLMIVFKGEAAYISLGVDTAKMC